MRVIGDLLPLDPQRNRHRPAELDVLELDVVVVAVEVDSFVGGARRLLFQGRAHGADGVGQIARLAEAQRVFERGRDVRLADERAGEGRKVLGRIAVDGGAGLLIYDRHFVDGVQVEHDVEVGVALSGQDVFVVGVGVGRKSLVM